MKSIEAYTDDKLALMAKATKGPWVRERSGSGVEIYDPNEPDDSDYKVCPIGSFGLKDDTDAAVDSRNHRESELAALRVAVKALEVHVQELIGLGMAYNGWKADRKKYEHEFGETAYRVAYDCRFTVQAALREVAALLKLKAK